MSRRTLRLILSTPNQEQIIRRVVSLRFESPDGQRGVLPGHEPALTSLLPGAIHVTQLTEEGQPATTCLASETGLVWIDPNEVRFITRWIVQADSIEALLPLLEGRAADRAQTEAEARAVLQHHDAALRRALVSLQREVAR